MLCLMLVAPGMLDSQPQEKPLSPEFHEVTSLDTPHPVNISISPQFPSSMSSCPSLSAPPHTIWVKTSKKCSFLLLTGLFCSEKTKLLLTHPQFHFSTPPQGPWGLPSLSMRAEGQHQAGLCSSERPEHLPCATWPETPQGWSCALKNSQGASPRGAAQTQAVPAMEHTTFI